MKFLILLIVPLSILSAGCGEEKLKAESKPELKAESKVEPKSSRLFDILQKLSDEDLLSLIELSYQGRYEELGVTKEQCKAISDMFEGIVPAEKRRAIERAAIRDVLAEHKKK
jgi:hypothetical protein